MAVTFPLTLASFFDDVAVVTMTCHLSDNVNTGRTAGGNLIVNEHGTRIWHGRVTVKSLPHADAEDVLARIRLVTAGRATFYAGPVHYRQSLGANPLLVGVQNGYELSISGMTANKLIRRGTFLSLIPTTGKRQLFQTVEAATTNGSGVMPYTTVEPAIKPGYAAGNPIDFNPARIIARPRPNSLSGGDIGGVITRGATFEWEQI